MPYVADWSDDMSANCKPRVQLFVTQAMDGRIVRCGVSSSCQSAATSETVKTLLATSSSHVRSAKQVLDFNFFTFTQPISHYKQIYLCHYSESRRNQKINL